MFGRSYDRPPHRNLFERPGKREKKTARRSENADDGPEGRKNARKAPSKTHCPQEAWGREREKRPLRHAVRKQLRTKQAIGRKGPRQRTLNRAKTRQRIDTAPFGKTQKMRQQNPRPIRCRRRRNPQTRQPEVPQIMTVRNKLTNPVAHAVRRKTRRIVHTGRRGNRTNRKVQHQHRFQDSADDSGAKVLVRNAEIGKKTHRPSTRLATAAENAERHDMTDCQDRTPKIPTVPHHPTGAAGVWTLLRKRRTRLTPMFRVPLDISFESARLFAWFRGPVQG